MERAVGKFELPIYYIIGAWLILKMLWSVFTPGGEWPLPPAHYLSMAIVVAMSAAIVFGRSKLLRASNISADNKGRVKLLFWPALASGIILIGIRFTSDAAWWTGHLN